jgi:hypothetical protein
VSVVKNKLMFFKKEDLGLEGAIIFKCIFKRWDGEARTELIWLRTGKGGGRFWML